MSRLILGNRIRSLARTACDLQAHDALSAGPGCARAWMDRHLKLNDLLVVGTHNSYKTAIPPAVMAAPNCGCRWTVPGNVFGPQKSSRPPWPGQVSDRS